MVSIVFWKSGHADRVFGNVQGKRGVLGTIFHSSAAAAVAIHRSKRALSIANSTGAANGMARGGATLPTEES